jgi:exopolysaccharide biosynthesis polyprenyl glycosylphosphotransferase
MFRGDLEVTDEGAARLTAGVADPGVEPSEVTEEQGQHADVLSAAIPGVVPDNVKTGLGSAPTTRAALPSASRPLSWQNRYVQILVAIDLIAASLAGALGYLFRFGADALSMADVLFVGVLPLAWVGMLAFNKAYERRLVGVGAQELQRISRAFVHLLLLTALVAYGLHAEIARGLVFAALPLLLVLDALGRYGARKALHWLRRKRGLAISRVLAIGDPKAVREFAAMLGRDRYAGHEIAGACLPTRWAEDAGSVEELKAAGIRSLGDVDSIKDAVRASRAHCVAVLAGAIDAEKLRWIAWQIEGTETDLIVSPGMTEVAGRRLHIQPVAGLPLLYVDEPRFSGLGKLVKGGFDRVAAASALLVLAPFLLFTGLVVRLTSRGPALFMQTRVGRDGKTFRIVKFRTMVDGAEHQVAALAERNESDGLLFKIKDDPRVTGVGKVLRRFSIDELPQLLNVLVGSMSLVGPRPPLPSEVASYEYETSRRLLVKPGLTGLWQISGRSDLSWEESVRLDLRYVENWSFALDMMVLVKTVRAVLGTTGAY